MWNNKKRIAKLEEDLKALQLDHDGYYHRWTEKYTIGTTGKLRSLQKQVNDLKAILNEVVDYVYRENK